MPFLGFRCVSAYQGSSDGSGNAHDSSETILELAVFFFSARTAEAATQRRATLRSVGAEHAHGALPVSVPNLQLRKGCAGCRSYLIRLTMSQRCCSLSL